jgi:hypothetical protein
MLRTSVSFFNELATKMKTMPITSVSFFNELSMEKKKLCSWFWVQSAYFSQQIDAPLSLAIERYSPP